jgi:hypothetical protein
MQFTTSNTGDIWMTAASYTPANGLNANEFSFYGATGVASVAIATQGAVPIRFVTNSTQVGTWLSGGTLCINATAAISTEKLYVNGSINLSATGNLTWADASKNVRISQGVLAALTTGTVLIAMGYNAMHTGIVTGNNDIGIGQTSLDIITSASGCIGIGNAAGDSITTGDYQICIGDQSDAGATTTKTVALGYNAIVSASNTIALGGTGANAVAVVIGATAAVGTEVLSVIGGIYMNANAGLYLAGQSDRAGAQAGTLATAPTAGDPVFWVPIVINGTTRAFPVWALPA